MNLSSTKIMETARHFLMPVFSRLKMIRSKREYMLLSAALFVHFFILAWVLRGPVLSPHGGRSPVFPIPVELHVTTLPPAVQPESPPLDADKTSPSKPQTEALALSPRASAPTSTAASPVRDAPTTDRQIAYAPPSAQLGYHVQAMRNGQRSLGYGNIVWQSDGRNFSIQGDVKVDHKPALVFKSEGTVHPERGMSPTLYQEQRRDEATTRTQFNWAHRSGTTEGVSTSFSLRGGEQDQASIIWQIARLVQQQQEKIALGVSFKLDVVGKRQIETWQIDVVGQDLLESNIRMMKVWHLKGKPLQSAGKQSLDLWIAFEQNWYPVRIRFNEANGDYLDLWVDRITAITP